MYAIKLPREIDLRCLELPDMADDVIHSSIMVLENRYNRGLGI